MPGTHLDGDSRYCGATTVVSGQSTVYTNDKLWAVEGDQNTHNNGQLRAVYGSTNVYIEDKKVIVAPGDQAAADNLHPEPDTWPSTSSSDVNAY